MVFRICVFDSGGNRGIVEAMMLQKLFEITGSHPTELFDLFFSTSTGCIVSSLVNLPDSNGKPKFSALDIVNLYKKETSKILQTSIWRRMTTLGGFYGNLFFTKNRDDILEEWLGEARLKDSIKDNVLLSYDLVHQETVFFKSRKAKINPKDDFLLQDVIKATTAAPIAFCPHELDGKLYIDAIFAKNATLYALIEATRRHGANFEDIILLSLGTGHSNEIFDPKKIVTTGTPFFSSVFDSILRANNSLSMYVSNHILKGDSKILRLDPVLPSDLLAFCDSNITNLNKIVEITELYLQENEEKIREFAEKLFFTRT